MPKGRSDAPPPAPPGLSALPLATVTIGWNGGLPPSSDESLSVVRLWNTPTLRADDGLLVDRVRRAEARLEHVVVRIREAARLAAEERLHARVRRHGQIVAVALEPIAWQHDAVVAIAADEAARSGRSG